MKAVRILCYALLTVGGVLSLMLLAEYLPLSQAENFPTWLTDLTSWIPERTSGGGALLMSGTILLVCLAAVGAAWSERSEQRRS